MKKNKKNLKTRDHLMVKVINGATKAGVQKDRKKEINKTITRKKVEEDKECAQCGFPIDDRKSAQHSNDFCSNSCEEYFYA